MKRMNVQRSFLRFILICVLVFADRPLLPQTSLNTTLLGRWAEGLCEAVDVVDSVAYFGNGGYLEIVDFSDPASPVELAKLLMVSYVEDVEVVGSYAYVANSYEGLRVIDVSTPATPVEAGFFDTDGQSHDVTVADTLAYVADRSSGLRVIDVSTPSTPVEVGFFDTSDKAYGVFVSGGYAYVADNADGLRVIDVSTPSNPVEVGFLDTYGHSSDVFVRGDYAYLADGSGGLRVIDVSEPSNPVEVGAFESDVGYAYGITVNGDHAYLADGTNGLRVFDVSTPSNPVEVGFFDTGYETCEVYVVGNVAYVADQNDGLYIICNDLATSVGEKPGSGIPTEFVLRQNYPNPFNPETAIRFDLKEPCRVIRKVYDVLGREVAELVDGKYLPGQYEVMFDFSGFTSGIYFYQIQMGDFRAVKKMVALE